MIESVVGGVLCGSWFCFVCQGRRAATISQNVSTTGRQFEKSAAASGKRTVSIFHLCNDATHMREINVIPGTGDLARNATPPFSRYPLTATYEVFHLPEPPRRCSDMPLR